MLQVDESLIDALLGIGYEIAIETNGTIAVPRSVNWITVSPKANTNLVQVSGDELKLVFPQENAPPPLFESLRFTHHFLQPMDGPEQTHNTRLTTEYCRSHPLWRVSLQTHKYLGIP